MHHWTYVLLLLATAQQIAPGRDTTATVEGYVVQGATAEPIPKAHVSLELSGAEHDSELIATTIPADWVGILR